MSTFFLYLTIALLMSCLKLRCAALHRDVHNLFIMKGGATFTICSSIVYKIFIDFSVDMCYIIYSKEQTTNNNKQLKEKRNLL